MQRLNVAITESIGIRRKGLKHSKQISPLQHGNDQDRAHIKTAARSRVDAGIGYGIVAALHLPSLDAGGRETRARVQPDAEVGRIRSRGGAADQLISAGHEVVGLVRDPAKADLVRRIGGQPLVGDVRDPVVVAKGVANADAVAHLALMRAGERRERASRAEYMRGLDALFAACRGTSLRSFVLASGALGMYRHGPGEWIDETAPEAPSAPSMADRHAVDERVREAHREWGLPAVILRPPIVYGVGGAFEEFFLALMRRGLYRVVGDGSYLVNLVHVEDCAAAYRFALEKAPVGETFLVVDDGPVTMRELSDFLAREMGKGPPGRVPPFLAKAVVGRDAIHALMESVHLRNARIKSRLGWAPRYPTYRDGIPEVARSYLAE